MNIISFMLCILFGLTYQQTTSQVESDGLRFMVLGDFGYIQQDKTPHPDQQKVADHVMNRASTAHYDFMVAVGDNFYPAGLDSPVDETADILLDQTFHMKELAIDWFAVLGNHDLKGDMQAALELNQRFPLWKQTQPYYSKIMNIGDSNLKAGFVFLHSCDLVCVNTSNKECYRYMRKNVDFDGIQAQIEWLDQTLANMAEDTSIIWKVVVTHNPIFSAGKSHGDNHDLQRVILPIFKKYNVDLVLTGHDHNAQYLRMDMNDHIEDVVAVDKEPEITSDECILDEFINYDSFSSGDRESMTIQGEHMHHFVMGNSGIKHSRFCPSKHASSEGKLQYGNAVVGVGDILIKQDMIEVKLLNISNELMYSLKVIR